MEGFALMYLNVFISHLAPCGFSTDILRSTGWFVTTSICLHTWVEYHSWNCFQRFSFTALLTLMLSGWRRSVQLAGTITKWMWFSSSRDIILVVHWPLNLSKMMRAAWSSESDNFFLHCWKYGTRTVRMCSSVVSSFAQWFGVKVTFQSSGNLVDGRHRWVFPAYITCGGRKSPVYVALNTTVSWRLSPKPATSIRFEPSTAIVQLLTGT